MKKTILKVIIGTICIEALLLVIFILLGEINNVLWKSLGCAGLIILYCIPCLIHTDIHEKNKIFSNIGISLALFSCLYYIIILIFDVDIPNLINEITTIIISETWFFTFYSLIIRVNNKSIIKFFKNGTLTTASGINIYHIIMIISGKNPEGFFLRLYAILWVLTISGSVSLLILNKIHNKINHENLKEI